VLQGEHMVVIVQSDLFGGMSTRLCVPLSSSAQAAAYRVRVGTPNGGRSWACPEQALSITLDDLGERDFVGTLDPSELTDVTGAMRNLLVLI